MQPEHRDYLKSVLINKSNAGDDRALAIELLSRSQTPEAAEILKNYTITEMNDVGVDKNQELVFKAQAIEGLAGFQDENIALSYLNEISQKTDYSFLQDRTRRAQAAIKNEAPAVEKQDLDALKKIVE